MFKSRLYPLLFVCASFLTGCTDELVPAPEDSGPETDMSKYWYSRSRSAEENRVMMRHHALGFSYQAVSGEKCNIGDVTCQVLNLDYLEDNELCFSTNVTEVVDTSFVQRGIADYAHSTEWNTWLSTDLLLYQGEKWKHSYLHETISDTTLTIHNTLGLQTGRKDIRVSRLLDSDDDNLDEEDMIGELRRNPEKVLSENFRYALRKLEADRNNVAVIDSFINIFGTHVVTGVSVGGTCDLKVKTSKRFVSTYLEEQEYTRNAVNLLFKKKETIDKLTNQQSYRNLFRTAEMELKVRGGDLTVFDKLIADPSYDNAQASYSNFEKWTHSVTELANRQWNEGAELIDMSVTPIWMFIPDKDLAERVKVRVVASASSMRKLYGERNFTSAVIKIIPDWPLHLGYNFAPTSIAHHWRLSFFNDGAYYVVTDGNNKPSKIVAVTYYEYIPEWQGNFLVTYPVYENRIQLTEGVARNSDKVYSIKWLYDRYQIEEIPMKNFYDGWSTLNLYLYKGRILTEKPEVDEIWRETKTMPDYEWPGSLDINGNVNGNVTSDSRPYPVVKFLNNFYLHDNDAKNRHFDNLPGWHFNLDATLISDYYQKMGVTSAWFITRKLPFHLQPYGA